MPIDESDAKPTKGSKPNRGIRGRPTTTVRFTALRLADLRHDAGMLGRSVSEEVEIRIEAYARSEDEKKVMRDQLAAAQERIGSLEQELRTLREDSATGKGTIAMDDARAGRIAAAAIAAFVNGRKDR
ncbi:MAG: hypothetical protein WAN05_15715 [Roseiarcus sp.]